MLITPSSVRISFVDDPIGHGGAKYERYCDSDLANGTTLTVPAWKRQYELGFDFVSNSHDQDQGTVQL